MRTILILTGIAALGLVVYLEVKKKGIGDIFKKNIGLDEQTEFEKQETDKFLASDDEKGGGNVIKA